MNARRFIIAAVVAGLAVAGCSSSSKSGSSDTTPTTAAPKSIPKVTITATDFAYAMPAEIPSGYVDVTIDNKGKESHQVGFVKLGSLTYAQFKTASAATNLKVVKPDTQFVGGPNGADPGASTSAIVKLDPGVYGVVCYIPANADGKPHAAHGMIGKVNVVKTDESVDVPPEISSTITFREFSFDVPKDFDGKGTVEVSNQGAQVHELAIVKLAPGKTADDAKAFFLTPPGTPPPAGPPPFESIPGMGGITGLSSQQKAWLDMNLTPGNYLLICFFPDTSKVPELPHALRGMVKEFTIK